MTPCGRWQWDSGRALRSSGAEQQGRQTHGDDRRRRQPSIVGFPIVSSASTEHLPFVTRGQPWEHKQQDRQRRYVLKGETGGQRGDRVTDRDRLAKAPAPWGTPRGEAAGRKAGGCEAA